MTQPNSPKVGSGVNQVLQVVPVQFYGVRFLDDQGKEASTVVMEMGGRIFMPHNHLEWTKSLTGAKAWFGAEILRRIKSSEVPKVDDVDVVGS